MSAHANGSGSSTSPASNPPGASVQISAPTRTGSGVEFPTAPGAAYRLEGTGELLHFDPEAARLPCYFYCFIRLPSE